ncbi:MAG: type I methionyl aminopeptidase [Deltaproteobacteria bacterium]|nr:type I methionyl aminopeptidase [Deltaproteobacteria bacterium]
MVILKSPLEIEKMRASNRLVARILARLKKEIAPGVATLELDRLAEGLCRAQGAQPAFLGYSGFPYSLCVSINEEVVHGFPSKRRLKEGDIVSLDFGVVLDGFYGDSAITVAVGRISRQARQLMDVTKRCLEQGIEQARPGQRLGDISHAVQSHAEKHGFSVVRKFVGHGIGRQMHEEPQIPNYGLPNTGLELKAGMTLAIEPMINAGSFEVRLKKDGWTAVTVDKSLSAHFEHTLAVTDNGPLVLSSREGLEDWS